MSAAQCPALCVAAPGSNHGKTLVAAALARHWRNCGRRVRAFKVGPDFLDPMLLERASGAAVYNLDVWMGGVEHCRQLLSRAAREADGIVVEGVMGLFDGPSSTADVAEACGLPVAAVIDAGGMGQTVGAIALGLAHYRPELPLRGVLVNGVAGERHERMVREGWPREIDCLGMLARNPALHLPRRHLGLVQADELTGLDALLDTAASAVGGTRLADAAMAVAFPSGETSLPRRLNGVRIAVARDAAFTFLYPANLECLCAMGAKLAFFSPLRDASLPLPAPDAIYLPGGYPELHLAQLASNRAMAQAVREHVAAGKPLYAECGGLLYLLESLSDAEGHAAPLLGLLPGSAGLGKKLAALGYQSLALPHGVLRGHTFHYSHTDTPLVPAARGTPLCAGHDGEAFYRQGSIRASYLHLYFPSAPEAVAALFV